MREIIGFNNYPNDFANFALRAKLAKRYGHFGQIPMWGGVKLHEFYPPLSTVFVRTLGITRAVIFYFAFIFVVWTIFKDPLTAFLFLISYFHIMPALFVGRFAEFMGYAFVCLAIFLDDRILSGVFLGLGGLCYPTPLIFGSVVLAFRLDPMLFLVAFLMCGWWYVPFAYKRRKLSFSAEKRVDKGIFGIYNLQFVWMVNLAIFLFGPMWLKVIVGALAWFSPVRLNFVAKPERLPNRYLPHVYGRIKRAVTRKPFYLDEMPGVFPYIDKVNEPLVVIRQPNPYPEYQERDDEVIGSFRIWVWTLACYLLDKGIIVYNGLPSTEVSSDNLKVPESLPTYSVYDLGLKYLRQEDMVEA